MAVGSQGTNILILCNLLVGEFCLPKLALFYLTVTIFTSIFKVFFNLSPRPFQSWKGGGSKEYIPCRAGAR